MWIGTVVLVLISTPALLAQEWSTVSVGAWAGVVFSGALSIALAYIIWYYGVRHLGSSRTAVYSNTVPLVALLMFGVVAVAGCYGVQLAAARPDAFSWTALPPLAFVAGLPVGCIVVCVLIVDDIRDRGFDAQKGWRTTAVRHGLRSSRALFAALLVAAYLMPVVWWLAFARSPLVLLPWLTLPLALHVLRAVRRFDTTRDLLPMSPRTSLLSLLFAALLAVGLAA